MIDFHLLLLESSDYNVRAMAGENIALILEDRDENISDEEDSRTEPYYERLNELISELSALSIGKLFLNYLEGNKYTSKKEKVAQKSTFRDILASVRVLR